MAMKALTLRDFGQVKAERVCHEVGYDGKSYVKRLRCWSEHAGFFEVDPGRPRCSLTVGDWMVVKLHPSTWRSICSLFD